MSIVDTPADAHPKVRLRVPPNFFGIPFGVAGLATAWADAGPVLGGTRPVADVLYALAGLVWLTVLVLYLAQGRRQVVADLRHPVLAPFVPLAAISALLPAAALDALSPVLAQAVVVVLIVVTLLLGGWITGRWIAVDLDSDLVHPGYFLPTVAGGLLGGTAAAEVGLPALAALSFGIGVLCWFLLGSIVLNRLFLRGALPTAIVPTLAIELAPPAVAGGAWFALTGARMDLVSYGLAGYTVLMVLVQLRLLPLYRALRFGPGFWAFTFSYAAAVSYAMSWVAALRPVGAPVYAIVLLVMITGFVLAIAARTAALALQGKLFPAA